MAHPNYYANPAFLLLEYPDNLAAGSYDATNKILWANIGKEDVIYLLGSNVKKTQYIKVRMWISTCVTCYNIFVLNNVINLIQIVAMFQP